jgi:hypothetical protein
MTDFKYIVRAIIELMYKEHTQKLTLDENSNLKILYGDLTQYIRGDDENSIHAIDGDVEIDGLESSHRDMEYEIKQKRDGSISIKVFCEPEPCECCAPFVMNVTRTIKVTEGRHPISVDW